MQTPSNKKFLGLGLENISYRKLEVPCRVFPEGRAKTALVSWYKIAKQKVKGGLGITLIKDVSETLKMRYVGRVMGRDRADWANMTCFILHIGMGQGCWKNFRQKLREAALATTLQQQQQGIDRFQTWIQIVSLEGITLQDSTSWEGESKPWNGFWSRELKHFEAIEDLTSKWTTDLNQLTWKKRWSLLWQQGGSNQVQTLDLEIVTSGVLHGRTGRKGGNVHGPMPTMQQRRIRNSTARVLGLHIL
ncbi:hypothetical protein R1sor_005136 [Riccia sorocarpa]|uniref:Ribosomal protein S3 n=1 Tax=Riccia sorocarpa TaxID=122646 RepID=A0ABD3HIP1_9MARC